ncbi:unnamed protein product, partial [Linum tenue]
SIPYSRSLLVAVLVVGAAASPLLLHIIPFPRRLHRCTQTARQSPRPLSSATPWMDGRKLSRNGKARCDVAGRFSSWSIYLVAGPLIGGGVICGDQLRSRCSGRGFGVFFLLGFSAWA